MRRGYMFFVLVSFLLLASFSVSFAGAASSKIVQDLKSIGGGIYDVLKPVFEAILGTSPDEGYFLARILILLIVFAIVWAVLSRIEFFEEQTWVLVVVSVAVSLLGVRFLISPATLDAIILPYKTLAIAISAGIPFVIAAIIIESDRGLGSQPKTVRMIAWIFIMAIFLGLWVARYDAISAANNDPAALFVYPITAVLAFVMILFDGTFQRWKNKMALDRAINPHKQGLIIELRRKIQQANTDLANGVITQAQRDRLIRDYQKKVAALSK